MKNKRKGISLITLVITIIIVMILAGAVILSLSNNNPIENANKARIMQDIDTFKSELALSIANKVTKREITSVSEVNASGNSIFDYIPSMKDKKVDGKNYSEILVISDGKLAKSDEAEISPEVDAIINQALSGAVASVPQSSETSPASGLYKGDVFTSWADLKEEGYFTVTNGTLSSTSYRIFSGNLIIDSEVTSIGRGLFNPFQHLTSITIPNSVNNISGNPFRNCEYITVESGNTVYNDGNGNNCIIETATNKLIIGCKNTVIPNSVTSIGKEAFYSCSKLTSIDLPNSIVSIENEAFYNCKKLTSIDLPNSITSIEEGTFAVCTALTNIEIPSSVTSIEEDAFEDCTNLTSITVNKAEGSLEGAPWGATNATVTWNP